MSRHLLVTNDFPPKVGGIQNYLYELWSRLDPDSFAVLTTNYPGAEDFDREVGFRVQRVRGPLLPTASLVKKVDRLAEEFGADIILLDPALPLGMLGPRLHRPYGLVLHGAEVVVPSKIPVLNGLLKAVMRDARILLAAGRYPAQCAYDLLGDLTAGPAIRIVNPGVDVDRFVIASEKQKLEIRSDLGLTEGLAVLFVSRLVPRKGADSLIKAMAMLNRKEGTSQLWIVGSGRDKSRLERLAERSGVDAVFLGKLSQQKLVALYGAADIFAMLCRNRWFGLEQEGFGIVFLEAQACGVPCLAGDSGGARDALEPGRSGFVLGNPRDVKSVSLALDTLIRNPELRLKMGSRARYFVESDFDYRKLADILKDAIDSVVLA